MTTDEIRARIDNALTVMAALRTNEPHAMRLALASAGDALKVARGALTETEAELDVLTAPNRNPAADAIKLRKELDAALSKIVGLEQDLAMLRQERDVERQMQAADRKRLAELEKQHGQYEALLLKDNDAFAKYMDRAVEADEKKRGRKPPTR